MRRQVTAHLEIDVTEPAPALQFAVATGADEQLTVTRDGAPQALREVAAPHDLAFTVA